MVEQFSHKDDTRLYCSLIDLISLEDKTKGFQWLQENQSPSSIAKIKDSYYVLSSATKKKKVALPEFAKKFMKNQKSLEANSMEDH